MEILNNSRKEDLILIPTAKRNSWAQIKKVLIGKWALIKQAFIDVIYLLLGLLG